MKFAKELEQDLVPEWRAKYLNYKGGKKKLKTVTRALRNAEESPWVAARRNRGTAPFAADETPEAYPPAHQSRQSPPNDQTRDPNPAENGFAGPSCTEPPGVPERSEQRKRPTSLQSLPPPPREQLPLKQPGLSGGGDYGSMNTSAEGDFVVGPRYSTLKPPSLTIDTHCDTGSGLAQDEDIASSKQHDSHSGAAKLGHGAGHQRSTSLGGILPGPKNIFRARGNSFLDRPTMMQMFSFRADREQSNNNATDAFADVRIAEAEFFSFLDRELGKIEFFYKTKEEEASDRLASLKSQLHQMRDNRAEELTSRRFSRDLNKTFEIVSAVDGISSPVKWKKPVGNINSQPGSGGSPTKRASTFYSLASNGNMGDERGDYVRRKAHPTVPYRSAKRKLKLALVEFYRGLELLKAYAALNMKAFQKMNKKYDKVTNARPTGRYMSEKVNKAWFVRSDVIENHLVAVEDLYTRYIERGHRKTAIGKLRGKPVRVQDYSSSAFRNGLMLAAGLVLAIQGLVNGVGRLKSDDDLVRVRTSYLFQLYGGYFLVVLHFLFFCLNCMVWSASKINYAFVFEFDARHVLDWRQLGEIPSLCMFLLGLTIWLNFRRIDGMYIYFPVLLIVVTVVILLLPAPILYHRGRKWWAYSNWRLLFSGLYPVEFRDFFMGDMYSSQTYAMGNIALLSCLYAQSWNEPGLCNSSHSRAMGFLTTVPSIWRAFQCVRRYQDTGDKFPHVVNFGKYTCSILYYMTLSIYRIERTPNHHAIFIVFACINAMYTSVWDLAMDWSLGNPHSKDPFLRDFLAFQRRWIYYVAMIIDPILRFTWILYAIFTHSVQHSAMVSFIVSLLEVCRRGMWSIFRVENEHCTNVCRFRASRDTPLPYDLPPVTPSTEQDNTDSKQQDSNLANLPPSTTGADVERAAGTTLRHRGPSQVSDGAAGPGTFSRVGTMLATAHSQDFQRRRSRSLLGKSSQRQQVPRTGQDSSTEEDADEEEDDDNEEGEGAGHLHQS